MMLILLAEFQSNSIQSSQTAIELLLHSIATHIYVAKFNLLN
jgi:hypothetical protein